MYGVPNRFFFFFVPLSAGFMKRYCRTDNVEKVVLVIDYPVSPSSPCKENNLPNLAE